MLIEQKQMLQLQQRRRQIEHYVRKKQSLMQHKLPSLPLPLQRKQQMMPLRPLRLKK
jgi:hypothetical protein